MLDTPTLGRYGRAMNVASRLAVWVLFLLPVTVLGAGPLDFFVSESDGTSVTVDPASAVFANVTGKGLAPDEALVAIETVITIRNAAGALEPTRRVVAALCVSRGMVLLDATGQPLTANSLDFGKFVPAVNPRLERLRVALCDGELIGVPSGRRDGKRSGWIHFLEEDRQAIYLVRGGMVELTPSHLAVRGRLYEFGGSRLADGRRFDARDAVWVIDCGARSGTVAYERMFARVDNDNVTVTTLGAEEVWSNPKGIDPASLKFAMPRQGSLQGRLTGYVCDSPERKGR